MFASQKGPNPKMNCGCVWLGSLMRVLVHCEYYNGQKPLIVEYWVTNKECSFVGGLPINQHVYFCLCIPIVCVCLTAYM